MQINQIINTIVSFMIKLISDLVTNLNVVADHITVKKIVKFRYDFTLNGWTNLKGIKVNIDKIIITIRFIQTFEFNMKK